MKQSCSLVKRKIHGLGVMCGTLAFLSTIEGSAGASERIRDTRVIGGENAKPGQFPFAVSLHDYPAVDAKASQFCGGTLIAPEWILTAAHCVSGGLPVSSIRAAVGHTKLSDIEEYLEIAELIIHPDYSGYEGEEVSADIALIRLMEPVPMANAADLALSSDAFEQPGTATTTIGWGTTSAAVGITPNYLQFVEVPLIEDSQCDAQATAVGLPYFDDVICAGYEEGGKDACSGDSGGALLAYDSAGTAKIVGIVAYGNSCALPDNPGYYTRVSSYSGPGSWLELCMSGDPSCDSSVGEEFTCGDGSVIPAAWQCDGAPDCADASDEADCEDQFFVCDDGEMLPIEWECDAERDCQDGSDEVDCDHPTFTCDDGSTIPEFFVCDGFEDCPGQEDEIDCPAVGFECSDGSVIPDLFVCDGFSDCPDGEDEADSTCNIPTLLIETVEVPPGSSCPNGGLAIHEGIDADFDGQLSPEEIESTNYLCHGINDMSRSSQEPKGVNCAAGGQKIQFGLDSNGNNVLEDFEVRDTFYVCNGEDGDDGAFANCSVDSKRRRDPLGLIALIVAGLVGFASRRRQRER